MTYTLEWRPACAPAALADEPFDVWRSYEGDVSTTFHRTPTGFFLRFIECGDYDINLAEQRVICTPAPDVPEDYCENIFSNQILPLLWTYEGTPVLHASGVVIDGGAFGFLGQSGRGKSTMAAAFARAGYAFLTDDGLLLEREAEGYGVRPYLPSIRLLPDSRSAVCDGMIDHGDPDTAEAKIRVPCSDTLPHAQGQTPLRAIYVLKEPESDVPVFEPLSQARALDALLQHSFLLDSGDKARVRRHFAAMSALAQECPIFALDYPRDFSRLADTIKAIAEHARAVAPLAMKGPTT